MNNTVLVVIVLVVLLVAFIMWQNSQAQKSQNEQMLWLMQNQNNQGESNMWSSMGNWSDIIGGIGGLFGGGGNSGNGGDLITWNPNDDDTDSFDMDEWARNSGSRLINTSPVNPPYAPSTQVNATLGFNNLQNMVDNGWGIELNG